MSGIDRDKFLRDTDRAMWSAGRDWSDAAARQGMPWAASDHLPQRLPREQSPAHTWVTLLAFRTVREDISVLSHPVCGNLLQQLWETNKSSIKNCCKL